MEEVNLDQLANNILETTKEDVLKAAREHSNDAEEQLLFLAEQYKFLLQAHLDLMKLFVDFQSVKKVEANDQVQQ